MFLLESSENLFLIISGRIDVYLNSLSCQALIWYTDEFTSFLNFEKIIFARLPKSDLEWIGVEKEISLQAFFLQRYFLFR